MLEERFNKKFRYNGEPKVLEPYERLDYDQSSHILDFIKQEIQDERKKLIEEIEEWISRRDDYEISWKIKLEKLLNKLKQYGRKN